MKGFKKMIWCVFLILVTISIETANAQSSSDSAPSDIGKNRQTQKMRVVALEETVAYVSTTYIPRAQSYYSALSKSTRRTSLNGRCFTSRSKKLIATKYVKLLVSRNHYLFRLQDQIKKLRNRLKFLKNSGQGRAGYKALFQRLLNLDPIIDRTILGMRSYVVRAQLLIQSPTC